MAADKRLTQDDTLLWLNDRLGKSVYASVDLDKGDSSAQLLAAEGELRHWRKGNLGEAWAGHVREDIAGLYEVGDASLDLTDIAGRAVYVRTLHVDGVDHELLVVALAEDVTLTITEQAQPR